MHHLKKAAALGFLVFLGLWVAGIVRGLTLPYPQPPAWQYMLEESFTRLTQAHNLKQIGIPETALPLMLGPADVAKIQVHEKSAQLGVGTPAFDESVALIQSNLAAHQAAVLNEKNTGIAPERRLTLQIGVPPDKFDGLLEQLRHIGQLGSVSVQQRDRTGDFRRLHAQRESVKTYLESVLKLRGVQKPSIDDALKLEQRIQEIEKELQALSVQFGDFLGKESLYNIFLTLYEYQPGSKLDRSYTPAQRVLHALPWALTWWFVVAGAVGIVVASYLSIRTLRP